MMILALLAALGRDFGLYHIPPKDIPAEKQSVNAEKERSALGAVTDSIFSSAETGVKIALNLIGIMAFFLGLMRILEKAGAIASLTKIIRPLLKFLFPGIPGDHPAMGAMVMNIASNMLGLGNAATPFGLKAMEELQELNPRKDKVTPSMATFLVINTSAITLIPATVMSIRAAMESKDITSFVIPSIIAATCATIVGIIVVKSYYKLKGGEDE